MPGRFHTQSEVSMKKVVIAQELHSMLRQGTFLNRKDISIFRASSNEDILRTHQREYVDLIITCIDLPGMETEKLFLDIRTDPALRGVRLIMITANTRNAIEQSSRCKPDAVILRPVNPAILMARAGHLLDVAARETFRVLISVSVEGTAGYDTFFCKSRDISATGMLLETEKRLTRGAKLACSFFLPGSKRLQAAGEIVRTIDGTGEAVRQYGVRFLKMDAEDRIALESFVAGKSLTRAS